MSGFTKKILCFALFLCSLHYSSSSTVDLKTAQSLGSNLGKDGVDAGRANDFYYEDDLELSVGAIVGIGIAAIVIIFGIPILLCFCCAWCCFRSRRNKSTVVVASPMPQQYVPQQYNISAVHAHHQNVPPPNYTNGPPTYDPNQNAYRDNRGFSVYPGSGNNLHATQPPNQFYNYNNGVSPPPPNPRFTNKNQTPNYEQRPPYSNVAPQYAEQYQTPRGKK